LKNIFSKVIVHALIIPKAICDNCTLETGSIEIKKERTIVNFLQSQTHLTEEQKERMLK
jgi:uncharacterized OB-fold protein